MPHNYRQIGGALPNANPTQNNRSSTPHLPPSIPSKFPTPNLPPSSKNTTNPRPNLPNTFGNTIRFNPSPSSNQTTPSPGYYHTPTTLLKSHLTNGSVSQRGYTSMISKSSRFSDVESLNQSSLPGPGSYTPQQGRSRSRNGISYVKPQFMFAKPKHYRDEVADVNDIEREVGPGEYNLNRATHYQAIASRIKSSSFASQSDRFVQRSAEPETTHIPQRRNQTNYPSKRATANLPPPIHESSSFKSTSARLPPPPKARAPDVCTYDPLLSYKKVIWKTGGDGKGTMSSTNDNNYGGALNTGTEMTPGPGWYDTNFDVVNSRKENDGKTGSSSFVSKTKRLEEQGKKKELRPPGPAYYKNVGGIGGRKGFHFNGEKKWV